MKKILSIGIVALFVISCSKEKAGLVDISGGWGMDIDGENYFEYWFSPDGYAFECSDGYISNFYKLVETADSVILFPPGSEGNTSLGAKWEMTVDGDTLYAISSHGEMKAWRLSAELQSDFDPAAGIEANWEGLKTTAEARYRVWLDRQD